MLIYLNFLINFFYLGLILNAKNIDFNGIELRNEMKYEVTLTMKIGVKLALAAKRHSMKEAENVQFQIQKHVG